MLASRDRDSKGLGDISLTKQKTARVGGCFLRRAVARTRLVGSGFSLTLAVAEEAAGAVSAL